MQNAGQQYCQGGSTSHQNQVTNFGQSEPSNTNTGGSTTSSLRQFRRKVEDKHQSQDNNQRQIPESHVARVAPQNHYPPRTSECYRYPNQYQDYSYSVPSQVKYSEISEPPQSIHQEHISPGSVIQKAKPTKDYMEICNPQHVVKQPYNDIHMNNNQQQPYNDGGVLPQTPYIPKDTQVHPLYKPESQYYPKEPQYPPQLQHQMQKYNMQSTQIRKYPSSENEFLSKLQQINPMVARSIMSDHHLQETQKTYQNLDQNRMYPMHHNQRYMNHPSALQGNHYPHSGFMPPQHYPNYPSSCNFSRSPQMSQPRFPSISPHERSISPRRSFSDGITMSMSYPGIPPKISPNYPQYNAPDFAQHYQQRRPSVSQDYYQQQHCRPAQYLPHQMPAQEIAESRVTVSDSIKQYIENWADEETASEMNQTEANRFNKDGLRVRDDQLSETVYTINASELQYLEPLGESENGIPLVSIDNTSGMIRIVDKNGQVDFTDQNGERIVNVHIMEPTNKSDCMLASNKLNEINQRIPDPSFNNGDKSRIVIQQNTVIQSSNSQSVNLTKEQDQTGNVMKQTKVGTSLPIITDEQDTLEEVKRTVIEEGKKEVVDKNCSPINMEAIEALEEDRDYPSQTLPNIEDTQKPSVHDLFDLHLTNIPGIETLTEEKIDDKPKEENDENKIINNEGKNVLEEDAASKETCTKIESPDNQEEINHISETESKAQQNNEEKVVKEIVDNTEVEIAKSDNEKTKENIDEKLSDIKEDENNKTDIKKKSEDVTQQSKEKISKRSKRIFSVDDIINNIGHNVKKSKKENERRHSLHSIMEFLDKELNNTFVFDVKVKENDTKKKSTEKSKNTQEEPKVTEFDAKKIGENQMEVPDIQIPKKGSNNEQESKTKSSQLQENNLIKKPLPDEASQSSQDLQFRNVIKVEETNVLLHIAGELVEIIVSTVNGKKVITVTPMSSSTLVDFNDNYETIDSNDIPEILKIDEPEISNEGTQILEIESVPEVDCVEPSSEVIIGMDLSLEEEIKLDVAQTPVICTKAAKKAYDNDLQIPSITTSEDVNNKSDSYARNDKVSSTKEKSSNISLEESEDLKTAKSDREKLREFRKTRPNPKDENTVEDDDEEFVPFKDLIKARKMKKLKMLELKKNEEIVKADSTNKEDEVIKENIVDTKSCKTKDKKDETIKLSQEGTKKHKTSSSKNRSSRDKSEKRLRDKQRSSEKSTKDKNKSDKKNSIVEKASSGQDSHLSDEKNKNGSPAFLIPTKSDKESSQIVDSNKDKVRTVPPNKDKVRTVSPVRLSPTKSDRESSQIVDPNKDKVHPDSPNRLSPTKSDKKVSQMVYPNNDKLCSETVCLKEDNASVPKSLEKVETLDENSKGKCTTSVKTSIEQSKIINRVNESKTPSIQPSKRLKQPENGEKKKKLSLQEYNNRKRKLEDKSEGPPQKITIIDSLQTLGVLRSQRPKSLDDLDTLKESKPSCSQVKRKFSLGSLAAPNHFDWDETQSPKRNFDIQEKRFSEFRGLISDKSNMKPVIKQIEDKSLQNYKEKVQSKLSSLNIQIPKGKLANPEEVTVKNETSELMQKFLQNDKLTSVEMEKIKKIISYKRWFQQLDKVSPQIASNKNLEVRSDTSGLEKDIKLNLKKQTTTVKKKKRFRNLYSVSSNESEDEPIETKNSTSGDYSVVQSNCLAGVVPKLIIKRRPEMPLPFVKLERLDLDVLYQEKRVCIE